MRRKFVSYSLRVFALVVIGCVTGIIFNFVLNNHKVNYEKYSTYSSTIQKSDCYLCGNNPNSTVTQYLGQSNIGIVNLNTFECFRFELNRYDNNKQVIKKLVKYGTSCGWQGNEETGSTFSYDISLNRGYITATMHLNDNSDLLLDNIQRYLCMDCLDSVMEEYSSDERHWDIAVIDFENREIKPFTQSVVGFNLSDYYISVRYDSEYDRLNLSAFYAPDRYSELDYDPNISVIDEILLYCETNDYDFTLNDEVKEFLNGFDKIGGLSFGMESVTFKNESFIGTKELTITKEGEYTITDFGEYIN